MWKPIAYCKKQQLFFLYLSIIDISVRKDNPMSAPASPPPPRATSAKASVPESSEKSEATEEETAKRSSVFKSVSHGLRKALRNSLISGVGAITGDSGSSPAPVIVDENLLKEGMLS